MEILLAGLISVLAILFLLLKIDIRKVLAFDIWVDIGVTALLVTLFAGTFSGMFAACVSGAVFSIILYVLKQTIGYKRLTFHGGETVTPKWQDNLRL